MLFLDASTDVLVRRYEGSRRRHPIGEATLEESIEREREMLEPLKAEADVVLDTSDLNVHQLRGWIIELFAGDSPDAGMQVSVVSFGYKHGLPIDVDLVFDCRFLPNPHWVDELRPLTGLDGPVREYVLERPETKEFLAELDRMFGLLLPGFIREGKSYLAGRGRLYRRPAPVGGDRRGAGPHPQGARARPRRRPSRCRALAGWAHALSASAEVTGSP